ncbi:hypothetical protein EDB92DRAFT_145052 [Lactarius akahatsu]|uniref:Uncharacterized protein n=1 Tax=Lactarius akahatsu TaxID=416441 RepID=A0AAD4L6A2_9AGAM|nr:hypothetical protein EDB92DRAFT_145052 [Lactarius akahatsu]
MTTLALEDSLTTLLARAAKASGNTGKTTLVDRGEIHSPHSVLARAVTTSTEPTLLVPARVALIPNRTGTQLRLSTAARPARPLAMRTPTGTSQGGGGRRPEDDDDYSTGVGNTASGVGKPSMTSRVKGAAEKMTGKIMGDPGKQARGQEREEGTF